MLTGGLPSKDELSDLQNQIQARSQIHPYIWTMLEDSLSLLGMLSLLAGG